MTKVIGKAYNLSYEYKKYIFWTLALVVCLFIFSYCLNVYHIITNSAQITKNEAQIAKLMNDIRALDQKYLTVVQNMTEKDLSKYEMSQGKVAQYITKKVELGKLASNNVGL
jgi:hypothetical protein